MAMSQVVNTYPLSNYSFGTKEPKLEKDTSVADRLARMKINYMKEGMRTSVEGILLVQEHNHPHILLLQIGNTFCKLPGGRLKPGENEADGLKRKLTSKLGGNSAALVPDWTVGECVATWWRPNFETMMYPYCPPHITKPKECKRLYIVHLSEKEYFAVPKNLKLLAVPLFELYDNVQRASVADAILLAVVISGHACHRSQLIEIEIFRFLKKMNFLNSAASICRRVSLRELITEVPAYSGSSISDGSSSGLSLVFKRWATKKTAGSTKNGRDSNPKFLGVKKFGGESVIPGNIIVRQRGTRFHPGDYVGIGKDHTLFALKEGRVRFEKSKITGRKWIHVDPTGGHVLHPIYTKAAAAQSTKLKTAS